MIWFDCLFFGYKGTVRIYTFFVVSHDILKESTDPSAPDSGMLRRGLKMGRSTELFAQTAQIIQQSVALMFMMINAYVRPAFMKWRPNLIASHSASIWQRSWVSYGLQLGYLVVWGVTVASATHPHVLSMFAGRLIFLPRTALVNIPANGRSPIPKTYLVLAIASKSKYWRMTMFSSRLLQSPPSQGC